MVSKTFESKKLLRGFAAGLLLAAIAVSPARSDDGNDDGDKHGGPGLYAVTLTNTTYAQGFSFPVAATHDDSIIMFEVGHFASAAAAQIAQNGNPVAMYNALRGAAGVTGLYGGPFTVGTVGNPAVAWPAGLPYFDAAYASTPGLYPTVSAHTLPNNVSFTIAGNRDDRFSILMMLMCTNDGLTGLDAVKLPKGLGERKDYDIYAYDAGVEINTEKSNDIVNPCGLMAPYAHGMPQVSTTDGNVNSPPSGSDLSIAEHKPIARYSNPTIKGIGDVPTNFGWDANRPVGKVTITRIN